MADNKERILGWFTENGSYKLVALFITLVLWVTFLGRRESVYTGEVTLEYLTKDSIVVANEIPDSVEVRVSGPQMRLKKVSDQLENSLTLDLSNHTTGKVPVTIPIEQLQLPFGTKVLSVSPERITVDLDRLMVVSVPVEVKFKKNRKRGWKVLSVTPSMVIIKGASNAVSRLEKISTKEIDTIEYSERRDEKVIEVSVPLSKTEGPGIQPFAEQSVTVKLGR